MARRAARTGIIGAFEDVRKRQLALPQSKALRAKLSRGLELGGYRQLSQHFARSAMDCGGAATALKSVFARGCDVTSAA
jgi:hypothetical protein